MTYEERQNAIGSLLREKILPRYKRPEHMDDATARAELQDMVADLNAEWPIMPDARFAATAEAFARALRTSYASRTWPPIAQMIKALKAALSPSAPPKEGRTASKLDLLDIRALQLMRWCKGEGPCSEHLITRANLIALAEDGMIDRGQVESMLAFAPNNLGLLENEPECRDRRGEVTIRVTAMPDEA